MEPTPKPAASSADTANGCAKGCITIFAFCLLLSGGFAVWGWATGSESSAPAPAETVRMTGTILLSAANCSYEQQVRINPRGGRPELLAMDGNAYRPGQPCNLKVDMRVEKAPAYEIDVKDVGKETFPHDMIATRVAGQTVLEFRLAW